MRTSSAESMTRRRLIRNALAAGSIALTFGNRTAFSQTRVIALPPLPYGEDALAPVISSTTISFHYGKHHRAYIENFEQGDRGYRLDGKVSRGHRQGDVCRSSPHRHIQECRAGVESYPLLEQHAAEWRRSADRRDRRPHQGLVRRLYQM